METNYTKEQQYMKAHKRVKDIKGFYSHVIVMVILLPFLVFVRYIPSIYTVGTTHIFYLAIDSHLSLPTSPGLPLLVQAHALQ